MVAKGGQEVFATMGWGEGDTTVDLRDWGGGPRGIDALWAGEGLLSTIFSAPDRYSAFPNAGSMPSSSDNGSSPLMHTDAL